PALPARLPALVEGWFFERLGAQTTPVRIWGAGHVGRALAQVLAPLPRLAVTLVDTDPARFPDPLPAGVTARIAPDMPAALADTPTHAHHFIVTYSHDIDFALCDALLTHGFASAGLIGSATKRARFRSRLVQMGHAPAAIDRISCPIGTPELGKEPTAIAVGAAHTLLMELAKKEAQGPNAEQGAE
ncbi:MAG: XdhC family protein, partial [Maritimibacter sp.]|nr:XdhC family protein [Maritimibacter sp.]